jgi:hypothetical protein
MDTWVIELILIMIAGATQKKKSEITSSPQMVMNHSKNTSKSNIVKNHAKKSMTSKIILTKSTWTVIRRQP